MAISERRGTTWGAVSCATVLVLLSTVAGSSCKRKPPTISVPWSVRVEEVLTPSGEAQGTPGSAALRCNPQGEACEPLSMGGTVVPDALLRTTPGTQIVLLAGEDFRLRLAERSEAVLQDGTPRAIVLRKGGLSIDHTPDSAKAVSTDAGASTPGATTVLKVRDVVGEFDSAFRTRVVASSVSEEKAELLVAQGKLVVRGAGQTIELRAAEGARLVAGKAPERTVANSLPSVETARAQRNRDRLVQKDPRGFGTMTARVPGTTEVVGGVKLASHVVRVAVRDGFARTEIEEVFENETDWVLEGRYKFPLPADASISRLALWVNDKLVEGEVVERKRAAEIFNAIVEDTVRPRDPALLEWVSGGDFSLKIFPIPAKGSRKVLLAYNQSLLEEGGRVRYVYPLSLGADRAQRLGTFKLDIAISDTRARLRDLQCPGYWLQGTQDPNQASLGFSASSFLPTADFALSYEREPSQDADVSSYVPSWGEFNGAGLGSSQQAKTTPSQEHSYVAIRFPVEIPKGTALPPFQRRDRVIVLDTSQGQSKETLEVQVRVATSLLSRMDPDERFGLLACDTGCSSYPEKGLETVSPSSLASAQDWLSKIAPSGASDLGGALLQATARLEANGAGQIVYLGDGAPSAGDLSFERIAAHLGPGLNSKKAELRLLGVGRSVDEVVLLGIARAVGATYESVATGDSLDERAENLALGLRRPVVTAAAVELPNTITEVYPRVLPNLRLGQEVIVVGKLSAPSAGEIKLVGRLGDQTLQLTRPLAFKPEAASQNPLIPRLWAQQRLADLQGSTEAAAVKEIVDLSKRYHVMSRHTSLLVLENEQMFAEFGVQRTTRKESDQSDSKLWAPGLPRAAAQSSLDPNDPLAALAKGSAGGSLAGLPGKALDNAVGTGASEDKSRGPRGTASVSASVSGGAINNAQTVVARLRAGFRACYNLGLVQDPTQQGTVRITALIGPTGEVRSASATSSGSLPSSTVACLRARVLSAQFNPPEGGSAAIAIPIVLRPAETVQQPAFQPPEQDTAVLRAGNETWRSEGEDELAKLRKAASDTNSSRKVHESLIRGLLRRGRFPEALTAARSFSERDPDLPIASELLSYAAVASGDGRTAVAAIAALAETEPRSPKVQVRAARAFEALLDERRACAHWRSLAELSPTLEEFTVEAFRCRARVLGEDEKVLAEARAIEKPGKLLAAWIANFGKTPTPAYDGANADAGRFEAKVQCESTTTECPTILIITPRGSVLSPWTPAEARSSRSSIAFSGLLDGVYRVLLVGGAENARGTVEVRVLGTKGKYEFARGGVEQTIASAHLTLAATVGFSSALSGWGGGLPWR